MRDLLACNATPVCWIHESMSNSETIPNKSDWTWVFSPQHRPKPISCQCPFKAGSLCSAVPPQYKRGSVSWTWSEELTAGQGLHHLYHFHITGKRRGLYGLWGIISQAAVGRNSALSANTNRFSISLSAFLDPRMLVGFYSAERVSRDSLCSFTFFWDFFNPWFSSI